MAFKKMPRPLSEVREGYDHLMGYMTGVQRKWWYGIEGITFIFHGAWSDPGIGYRGWEIDELDVSDTMWDRYNEESPKEEGQTDKEYRDGFVKYIQDNREDVLELLDDIVEGIEEQQGLQGLQAA